MKLDKSNKNLNSQNAIETIQNIGDRLFKNSLAKVLFLTTSLNLIIAPAVMAASGTEITRNTAYAIGILYCVTIALSVYLLPSSFNPKDFNNQQLTINKNMSILRETIIGIRTTFILWLLTALIYPYFLILIGQFVFPNQANGSLITNAQGDITGSALIGQNFTSDRYFSSRPSTTNYSTGDDAKSTGISGASNLAPSNPDLKLESKKLLPN